MVEIVLQSFLGEMSFGVVSFSNYFVDVFLLKSLVGVFFLNCLAGMSLENLWKRGRFMFYPKIGRLRKNKATKIMQMGVGETRRCCQSCFGNHLV